jgi:hypothetical protein
VSKETQGTTVDAGVSDERLKGNLIAVARHHKLTCRDPHCPVSMQLLGVLLDRAGIGVTEEEAWRLW